jgi:hypothetical protein
MDKRRQRIAYVPPRAEVCAAEPYSFVASSSSGNAGGASFGEYFGGSAGGASFEGGFGGGSAGRATFDDGAGGKAFGLWQEFGFTGPWEWE